MIGGIGSGKTSLMLRHRVTLFSSLLSSLYVLTTHPIPPTHFHTSLSDHSLYYILFSLSDLLVSSSNIHEVYRMKNTKCVPAMVMLYMYFPSSPLTSFFHSSLPLLPFSFSHSHTSFIYSSISNISPIDGHLVKLEIVCLLLGLCFNFVLFCFIFIFIYFFYISDIFLYLLGFSFIFFD